MKKKLTRLLTLTLAVVMMLALAVPAWAADWDGQYENDPKGNYYGILQFNKKLTVDEYAVFPSGGYTFTFTLKPFDKDVDDDTINGLTGTGFQTTDVYPGIMEGVSVSKPTGATYTVNSSDNKDDSQSPDKVTSKTITVNFAENKDAANKVITESFTIDFSKVQWTAPGVYRYMLYEVNSGIAGVTYSSFDPGTKIGTYYVIDVYVVDNQGEDDPELQIGNFIVDSTAAYTITVTDTDQDGKGDKATVEGKTNATPGDIPTTGNNANFANSITSPDLKVEKSVTGNQGDRNKEFKFTIVLDGLVSGGTYTVTGSFTPATNSGLTKSDSLYKFTPSGTSHTITVTMSNGKSINFLDLPYGATYTITEDSTSAAGYITTASVSGDINITSNSTVNRQTEDNTAGGTVTDDKTGDTNGGSLTANAEVTFTNNKDGLIPTGVLLTVAPFAALMVVGLLGAVIILKKKHTN